MATLGGEGSNSSQTGLVGILPPYKNPVCPFATNCYRRNPIHLGEYSHPHLDELLRLQKDKNCLQVPKNYKSKVDHSTILDQLKVLHKINAKDSQNTLEEKKSGILQQKEKRRDGVCNIEQNKNLTSIEERKEAGTSRNSSETFQLAKRKYRNNEQYKEFKKKCKDHLEPSLKTSSPFSTDMPARLAAAAPYYFFLTKVRSEPVTHHEPLSITFRELLDPSLGKLRASLQINFMVEMPWVMHHYTHHQVHEKPLLILYGTENDDLERNKLPQNITAVRIKTQHPFGHHHTKMSFFHYEDGGLRVVVSTANLVASDWHNRTQGLWVSPTCPQLPEDADTKSGDSPTEFKTDLLYYLIAYKVPELQEWISIVRRTDFSDIRVCFVGSVPGSHQGPNLDRWGHRRLATFLKKYSTSVDCTWSVIAQCSSIGSLGPTADSWMLNELRTDMSLGKGSSVFQVLPSFKVVYPSKQNVYDSLDGALGGDCLPYSAQVHAKQLWFREHLNQWKSSSRHRSRAVPHIKTYTRLSSCGNYIPWFHLTSANLSKAAWGINRKTKAGSSFYIMSYEAGVLFLPEMLIKKPHFCLNNVQSNEGSEFPFPMPYDVPLVRYSVSDKPWVMEYLNEYLKKRK